MAKSIVKKLRYSLMFCQIIAILVVKLKLLSNIQVANYISMIFMIDLFCMSKATYFITFK